MLDIEEKNKKTGPIFVYVCDDNFVWIMGISMISVIHHNPDASFYLFSDNISSENKYKLKMAARERGTDCEIIDIPEKYLQDRLNLRKWSSITFVRIFIGELLPESISKIIYLDCDTVIVDDLSPLWNMDIKDYICCGVKDCIGGAYKTNIGLNRNDIYINAGVLLINLEKMRHFPVRERVNMFLSTHYYSNSYGDQDTINAIFRGKIGCLPMRYNVTSIVLKWNYKELQLFRHPSGYYSEDEYNHGKEYPAVIHFTGHFWNIRPWYQNSDHEYTAQFLSYKTASPWSEWELGKKPSLGIQKKIYEISTKMPKNIFLVLIGIFHAEITPRYKILYQKLAGKKQKNNYF